MAKLWLIKNQASLLQKGNDYPRDMFVKLWEKYLLQQSNKWRFQNFQFYVNGSHSTQTSHIIGTKTLFMWMFPTFICMLSINFTSRMASENFLDFVYEILHFVALQTDKI